MGKGAYIEIDNQTNERFDIDYSNIVDVYQNGSEGSDFSSITGNIEAQGSLPINARPQYIEAISTSYASSFDMNISMLGDTVTLNFVENYHKWWVENPFAKLRSGSIQIATVVKPQGDQFKIAITIKYSVSPENWMEVVYDKIKDTALCRLPIPGSHDAMSYPDIELRSQTQGKSISDQLVAGFRYFDFRVKVNNGVYYGFHGGDNTEHDYTAVAPNTGNQPYILDDIANFLDLHKKEVVILNFSHFTNFDEDSNDFQNFVKEVQKHFSNIMVPRSKTPTVTYGDCVDHYQQVVVIISDGDGDKEYANNWFQYPDNTPQGISERENIWMSSDCLLERYSAIRQPLGGNLHGNIIETLQDQENYLEAAQPGQTGHRDLDKFWISQAVLNYDAVPSEGHSLNYWGAMIMNPLVVDIYEFNWRKGTSHSWDGNGTKPLLAPNILLLDFGGYFDGFPEACVRMLE